MSKIEFFEKEAKSYFLDPKEGFHKKELLFEIRKDNLTGHISRILPFKRRKLSERKASLGVLEASRKECPFCLPFISSSSSKFIPEIAPEGRIHNGKAVYLSRIQLRRFAKPEEIAPDFGFLASEDARYITGQILCVDGGYIG